MNTRRYKAMVTVPKAIVVLVVAAVLAAVLVTVQMPGPGPASGALPAGSQGSVSHVPWWDPRGWFSSSGGGAPGNTTLPGTAGALAYPPRQVRQAPAGPVHRVRELTSKRDEYSRVYQLSDGQEQAVVSAGPVNYRDPAGKWEPISTAVEPSSRPGYQFQNVSNVFSTWFGSSAGRLIRFGVPGGGWLSIGLAGGRAVSPRVSGSTVTYTGVAPGLSLSYVVTAQSLTERITLASASAAASLASLRFTVQAGGGLVPFRERDGSIAVTRDGVPVLRLPAPFMTDARRVAGSPYGYAWSPRVSQHVTWDAATSTVGLSLSPDAGWLGAAGREFPVVVDPTIVLAPAPSDAQNVMIESDTPSTNYDTTYRLSVGTLSSGSVRSLLKFNLPANLVGTGTQISSADLELYRDQWFGQTTATESLEADEATSAWTASTATWANSSNNVGQLGQNEVTVDDTAAGASASGSWASQADANAVNGEYKYNQDTVAGDTFTWVPQLTENGDYWVSVHYAPNAAAASNAPFTLNYSGGSQAYTVNEQTGTGGQWAVIAHKPFVAGTAGKIVAGDGPATASTRVEADQVRFADARVTADPSVNNVWDSFPVRNIVQDWASGSANDGFVVKAQTESALNMGGPRYEASFNAYNGETVTYPKLVITYGDPGVTMNPITTIHATGAELSWTPYVNSTGDPGKDLAEYQVHRSVFQSFTPASNTLVAPVAAGTTSFTDTTNTPTPPGGLGNAFYYMVAVKTKDGTLIPGAAQLVRLPTAGSTTQIINATGATTLSSAQPTTNEQHIQGQAWVSVGDDSSTFGTTRSVFAFPSMASGGIPADATVNEAHLKLWGFDNDTAAGAAYDAYQLTQSFDPATATWNNASSSTAWTTAGGAFNPTLLSQVTGLTNDPDRHNWAVTSAVQDWIGTPADEHGLIVKLDSSAIAERELFTDTSAAEPALRPELVVTYTEPSAADTYYAPQLPVPMTSNTSYTVPVTLTNTTATTWTTADWVLSYHWLAPDGTDLTTSADQVQTPLTASIAPTGVATINAAVKTPDTTGSGNARAGYQLAWDMFDKTTGTWLSSGTSTPALTASAVKAARTRSEASTAAATTVGTLNQSASVEQSASNMLGLEKYYQYTGINTGSGTSLLNNDDTGNVVWDYNAFSNPSRGFRTFVRMDYNSMDTTESSMGFGWSLQASTLQRLGTPLDFHPNPNPTTVTLTDGDGTTHAFTWNAATSTWTSPPGLHYYLQSVGDCSPNGKDPVSKAWLMTAPDRTQFWFDCQGFQSAIIDKNGNEADFTYTQRKSNNKPVKFLDYITDPAGRQTLTLTYFAKGQDYQFIDANGNVASGTNLTNPDMIDQIATVTDISGRQVSFLYNVQGEMAQMTDGPNTNAAQGPVWSGAATAAKVFKFGYDMTQGNKNVKLVSVTDPRSHATNLAYYAAPQDPKFKWSLETVTDRLQRTTGFAYTVPAAGGIQAAVTDPKTNVTTYLMDTTGRPVQVTNAKTQVTTLGYDSDNNVTTLTEDNGAKTTWTYDPNTGYPLTMKDAQANHDGTAGYVYTYQTALSGHIADLTSKLTPQQRLWKFGYDGTGNLKTVTKPLGNVTGAAAGSYTTTYNYDATGELQNTQDPDGNVTNYSNYDPSGYPGTITDPLTNATTYVYSANGLVSSVTDPLNHTTTQTYDAFGRPLVKKVPKDQASSVYITTPAPVYDGNDNITASTAPNGAVTNYVFDNDDELASKATPAETGSAQPTTTYGYDANGNLHTVTAPDGNAAGATSGSYVTTYGYDPINELTNVTDPTGGGQTITGYNDVGDKTSVTDQNTNETQYSYDLNHKPTGTQDAAGHTTTTKYDLDGLVKSQIDQNGNETLLTLDADGQVTQQQVPAQAPGASVTYDTTQFVYDQNGNKTQVISPRAVAAGTSVTSACVTTATCPFTTVTQYDKDNRVSAALSAYDPADPVYNKPAETDYTYDAAGRTATVSAPPSGTSTARLVTSYAYTDNGWVKSSEDDPWSIITRYTYNDLGEQATRTLISQGGDMTRTMTWGYYPDGKTSSVSDAGVPTGKYSEEVLNYDTGSTAFTGPWPSGGFAAGTEGSFYQSHAAGSGTDAFTWRVHIPQDGNYTVYVKYPAISGAAANAAFTVAHDDGTGTGNTTAATVSVDQTQNGGNWVALGKWAFTQGNAKQQVSLAENSSGTVIANAVKLVRDNTGQSNTATHTFGYTYDPDGNQTGITDTTQGTTIPSYVVGYDQLNRATSVQEDNASGTAVHTTTYGYDPASNLASMTHDGAPSTYAYNNLEQLKTQTDKSSATDPAQRVTSFTYTPTGQTATETKPNGNIVTDTYYASNQLNTLTEDTSGGTLVDSHAYTYNPDGDKAGDTEQLLSADDKTTLLKHTLAYTYDPRDRIEQVTTDGATTESYTHDADSNVTSQTIGAAPSAVSTTFGYVRDRLETASVNGGAPSFYNYDPLGRLDTVTSGTGTTATLQQATTYDGFDNIASHQQLNASGGMDTTTYTHDPLNRVTSQTAGGTTTNYSYLGLSSELTTETTPTQAKAYAYTPGGMRIDQATTPSGGTATYGYYTYNDHNDVEAVTGDNSQGKNGLPTATYGYTAYGQNIPGQFTGNDKNNATPGPNTTPYNPYRFNAMRWDASTGQYDMGFRNYDPGLNQFDSRDMYDGALADAGLTNNPFTGGRYAFGDGNPVSNIELDGHIYLNTDGGHCAPAACKLIKPPPNPGGGGGGPTQGSNGSGIIGAVASGIASAVGAVNGFLDTASNWTWNNTIGAFLHDVSWDWSWLNCHGLSFTANTKVLQANGKKTAIAALKPGAKVLATNIKTGKNKSDTVTAVTVRHDHNLYNLRIRSNGRGATIHTTANHPFWDATARRWVKASMLRPGAHLHVPSGKPATVIRGWTPKNATGWMWDLTVRGDHDFYVDTPAAPVLVHNNNDPSCGGALSWDEAMAVLDAMKYDQKTAGSLIDIKDGRVSLVGKPLLSVFNDDMGKITTWVMNQGVPLSLAFNAGIHPDSRLIWHLANTLTGSGGKLSILINNPKGPCLSCKAALSYILPRGYDVTVYYPGSDNSVIKQYTIQGIGPSPTDVPRE